MSQVFPSPIIVVGVGRFGLALLELLGEDFAELASAGADATLGNLRLLWVAPAAGGDGPEWRGPERRMEKVVSHGGDGDLPSLAFDFAALRALGLVRYRDGGYEVALPRDEGVAAAKGGDGAPPEEADGGVPELEVRRRRFFQWLPLAPDPIAAAERLRRLAQRSSELDLFIAPILSRIRQGHSPALLLRLVERCRALAEGRDPSPWSWCRRHLTTQPAASGGRLLLVPAGEPGSRDDPEALAGVAPEPLAGWAAREPGAPVDIHVPAPFVPEPGDEAPDLLALVPLLGVDWERTGWTSEGAASESVRFEPVDVSELRLGLFDHDGTLPALAGGPADLCPRLERLAWLLHRGLVRLWVDLQRDRVEEVALAGAPERRRAAIDDALRQSLEVLGELLVRPLVDQAGDSSERTAEDGEPTPAPSLSLRRLVVERRPTGTPVERELALRLAELGLAAPPREGEGEEAVPLLVPVLLRPEDVAGREEDDADERAPGQRATGHPQRAPGRPQGLLELRRQVNRQARRLLSASFLAEYRTRPTRRPPRLTVWVVGDMGEPFTRAALRLVLRELHAELLRAFSPIFEAYREGFDRCLSVVPVLWMPHPADPYEGEEPKAGREPKDDPAAASRIEEAAIVDAVQCVRRWVESVLPASHRRVSQVFVSGRVTDNAALSLADAARQTRDFIALEARNDVGRDEWLKRTAVGPGGDDLFASFSCHEIDFPAERCREYLATRLVRACLGHLQRGFPGLGPPPPEAPDDGFRPPAPDELVGEARGELGELVGPVAVRLADRVAGRLPIEARTSTRSLLAAFDEAFESSLVDDVQRAWIELSQARGRMDDMVDALRRRATLLSSETLEEVLRFGDELVARRAAHGGLAAVQASFDRLSGATRGHFLAAEQERRRAEAECLRHRIPDPSAVGAARAAVVAAAVAKPDLGPLVVGLAVWALLAPVFGAPFAHMVALFYELQRERGLLELLLGPLGWLTGGLAVALPAALLLRRHLLRRLDAVRSAVAAMAEEVRRLVGGDPGEALAAARASVRSFFEARLETTGVLAVRGYAARVHERALADAALGRRLSRSLDVQAALLARRAEALGVRPRMVEAAAAGEEDDLSGLFSGRGGTRRPRLIDPDRLHEVFRRRYGRPEDLVEAAAELVGAAGGLGGWRQTACLSDTGRLLDFGRGRFEDLVTTPVTDQGAFAEEVERRLLDFVARHYSTIGFGAKFVGYEGLDPDGIQVQADAALLLHPAMRPVFERARRRPGVPSTTSTMRVIEAEVRPNTAYMLSLVQGIRAHSVRNLKRFESFHDRTNLPDDRTFPLSGEQPADAPVNLLSPYPGLGGRLLEALLGHGGNGIEGAEGSAEEVEAEP